MTNATRSTRALSRLTGGGLAACVLFTLAGCGMTAAQPGATAHAAPRRALYLLVGVHRGEPAPGVPQAVAPLLGAAVRAAEPITVVAVDGHPRVVYRSGRYTISTVSGSAADDDVAGQTNAVLNAVSRATARSDGDDLAAAVGIVADEAASIGVQRPTDVIIDSGASDRGAVVMTTPGLTSAVPAEVADFVHQAGDMPDLHGAHVVEVGFGYTSPPQHTLPRSQQQAVQSIWRRVFERQGATVTVLPVPRTGAGPRTRFTTGTITPGPSSVFQAAAAGTTVFGPQSPLGFLPGKAQFADPAAARRQVRAWAAWLAGAQGRTARVVGTCAGTGSTGSQRALSGRRAAAVAAALVAAGAPAGSVSAEGVGIKFAQYVPDVTSAGTLNPVLAQRNRTVRVTLGQR